MSSTNETVSFSSLAESGLIASTAIVLPFRDLIAKSYQQTGQPVPKITFLKGVKEGVKAAPTIGFIVGGQLWLSKWIDQQWKNKGFVNDPTKFNYLKTFGTPAVVGLVTSPLLAIFNGYTNGLTAKDALLQLKGRAGLMLCGTIALQETAFVAGIKAKEQMKGFVENPFAVYGATFAAGAIGSLTGHPFNTALTRWQKNMSVSRHQLYLGAVRKTRAVGWFALIMKCQEDALNYFKERGKYA
jgi:hypothetical protein